MTLETRLIDAMAYQTQTSRRDIKLDVTVLQYAHVIYLVATWLSSPRAGDAGRAKGIRPAESHVRRAFCPFVWISGARGLSATGGTPYPASATS
jgi:hypothetical protein